MDKLNKKNSDRINYNLEEIKEKIDRVIDLILTRDRKLFKLNSSERSISNKLATYLYSEFPEWEIDCEYNRYMNTIKKLEKKGKDKRIYPDIIIHHRESKENLLVIEIKKSPPYSLTNQKVKEDLERLQKMTSDKKYKYQFGLFILFFVKKYTGKSPILKYYQNGIEVS